MKKGREDLTSGPRQGGEQGGRRGPVADREAGRSRRGTAGHREFESTERTRPGDKSGIEEKQIGRGPGRDRERGQGDPSIKTEGQPMRTCRTGCEPPHMGPLDPQMQQTSGANPGHPPSWG